MLHRTYGSTIRQTHTARCFAATTRRLPAAPGNIHKIIITYNWLFLQTAPCLVSLWGINARFPKLCIKEAKAFKMFEHLRWFMSQDNSLNTIHPTFSPIGHCKCVKRRGTNKLYILFILSHNWVHVSPSVDCAGVVLDCLFCRFYDMILAARCCPDYSQVATTTESSPGEDDDCDCGLFPCCQDAGDCLELAMEASELCYH